MIKMKFVRQITVVDPDTGNDVKVEIYKMDTGAMVGLDASFLEQVEGPLYSPYDCAVQMEESEDGHDKTL